MFWLECKKIGRSITYLIFVVVLISFAYSQLATELGKIDEPKPGLKDYGPKYEEIPELIMPRALSALAEEHRVNTYPAYPYGFFKNVKLNEKKQVKMTAILTELTGQPYSVNRQDVKLVSAVTYERFKELMADANSLIGGGSRYAATELLNFGEIRKSYEDALKEYQAIFEHDRISGAYARLFADYLGVVLSLLPVFIAVVIGLHDRRARMRDLVYTRSISSARVMFTRYAAMATLMFIPVVILSIAVTIYIANQYPGQPIDPLAFIKVSFIWLLPTLLMSSAVGVVITEWTDTPIAVAVQGIWWFVGLSLGLKHMEGGYGADLALRHNIVGNTQVYLDHANVLYINRISYTAASLLLVLIASWVYGLKRRGKLDVFGSFKKRFTNRRLQS